MTPDTPRHGEPNQRVAILLHGSQCTGKTITARLLWGRDPISLDDGKYEQLRIADDILVAELGCGERIPYDPQAPPGPTRNPSAWRRVLAEENRELFVFRFRADLNVILERARLETERGVTEKTATSSHQAYESNHILVTFPADAGIEEFLMDTTNLTNAKVVEQIRQEVAKSRPVQHWPAL